MPDNIFLNDWAQTITMATTVIGGILGYGKMQAKVEAHDEEIEKRVTKDSIMPFQEEILRRLERIERNQDDKVIK